MNFAPASSRRGRLAPLEYKDPAGGTYNAPSDPLAGGEEASFPVPKNLTPAVGVLGLWFRPFRPHTWPEIGGLPLLNMIGWLLLRQITLLGDKRKCANDPWNGLVADCDQEEVKSSHFWSRFKPLSPDISKNPFPDKPDCGFRCWFRVRFLLHVYAVVSDLLGSILSWVFGWTARLRNGPFLYRVGYKIFVIQRNPGPSCRTRLVGRG